MSPTGKLDPTLLEAMKAGKLNPWLNGQSEFMPRLLKHDFAKDGSPERHLLRMAELCKSVGSRLLVAYVPFCGVVSRRYIAPLLRLGMDPTTAEALAVDPTYRSQNRFVATLCSRLGLPLADTTEDLVQAEQLGVPQYWEYDTHPRPAGYATIARRLYRAIQEGPR